MNNKDFTPTEKKIMRLLYQIKAPLTAYEIAKETGISLPTVKKYLKQLHEIGIIKELV